MTPPGLVDVLSPMPATVLEVNVTVGDRVSFEDELILVESMKMQVPILAPQEGVVEEVLVKPGDVIEGDVPVLRLRS
jgi:acetyl-CoA carboxylase biotin carboxyl carrier protein